MVFVREGRRSKSMLSIWHSLGLMKNKQKSAYCLYYDCFSQLRDGMTLKIMALLHIKLYVFLFERHFANANMQL